jgi:indoleamine 2,3-dioxygenase
VATYATVVLWNFVSSGVEHHLHLPEYVHVLYTFTGTKDEAWFYAISIAIEGRGASIIPVILRAINAAACHDSETIEDGLNALTKCIQDISALLERMSEKCDPEIFYHRIRPFLAGTKNMAEAGLPLGVFYEESNGEGQWRKYSGGSNAQSSLIQLFDAVLGVEHRITREDTQALSDQKSDFISVSNATSRSSERYGV